MTEAAPEATTPDARVARDVAGDDQLERWKERGFVTTGEIFAAYSDLEPETAELAAIYATIRGRGTFI